MVRKSARNKKNPLNVPDTAQVTLEDPYDLPEYERRTKKNKDFITVIDSYDFEERPTGYKTLAQAPQIVKHQYNTWYGALKDELQLKNKGNIEWLIKYWPKVRALIDDSKPTTVSCFKAGRGEHLKTSTRATGDCLKP